MNRISSYASPLDLYRQVNARQESTPAQRPTPPAQQAHLSTAEAQHIQQQFPPSPVLSMRLYGPQAASQTVTPGALGTRLDLQG